MNLQGNAMSIITDTKNDVCSISIDSKIVHKRKCEFEYNPKLIFYAPLDNWNDVWVFQDIPMGNACDGGTLRIFERKSGDKEIIYRGEIDFCGGLNPSFELKRETLKIINEVSARTYLFKEGKIEEITKRK